MARWKLGSAHYLNTVQSCQWEYVEEGRATRQGPTRRRFDVPMLLDPKDSSAWTRTWGRADDLQGEIIVCLPGKGQDTDIEFHGDPTPEMFPVDDEARAISDKFANQWRYKSDSETRTYSQSLVDQFQTEMAERESAPQTVTVAGLPELTAALASQAAAIGQLLAANVGK